MNLFEVEGTKFIDNIPKDIKISIPKEEYAEYLILKEGCVSKKKIKAKIKELEDKKEQYEEQPLIYHILKNQLEELLEE